MEHGFSIYDAAILASALIAQCRLPYTEDLQHGRVLQTLQIVNSFSS
jgi:predicted nucleic acid-binding protein